MERRVVIIVIKVLIDSDALIAVVKSDDSNHNKALGIINKNKNLTLYITCFTVPECSTVLSYKVSQDAATAFLKQVRISNFNTIGYEQELAEESDRIFLTQKKKGISWFDCYNLAAFKSYKLDAIFSFDKFYSKSGSRILR